MNDCFIGRGEPVVLAIDGGDRQQMSHSAVIRDSATGSKAAILCQAIRPDVAIVDPYLTVTCPHKLKAESGIVAVTNGIEANLKTNFYTFEEADNASRRVDVLFNRGSRVGSTVQLVHLPSHARVSELRGWRFIFAND